MDDDDSAEEDRRADVRVRVPRGELRIARDPQRRARTGRQSIASMRHTAIWVALIVGGGSIGLAQGGTQTPAGGRQGGEGRTVILEQAPKDRSIAIPKDKLAQHLKDMDA